MKKRILVTMLLPLMAASYTEAMPAPLSQPQAMTVDQLSIETIDTVLAPIALYPDSVITHILIASTYPLQVVEADRWRKANAHLSGDALARAIEPYTWDPSIKALVSFTDVLDHMSNDLSWLQTLGDAVITNENLVLDRIQALRLQALENGSLQDNDYQEVSTQNTTIVIASRRPEVVYLPYYDPTYVYGRWHYHTPPVFWPTAVRISLGHRIHWGPSIAIAASFYFSDIWWPDRHIVIRRTPVHHYVRPNYTKRYSVKEYHRWQHNSGARHARYSNRVMTHKPTVSKQHRTMTHDVKHRALYTKTQIDRAPTVKRAEKASKESVKRIQTPAKQVKQEREKKLVKSERQKGNQTFGPRNTSNTKEVKRHNNREQYANQGNRQVNRQVAPKASTQAKQYGSERYKSNGYAQQKQSYQRQPGNNGYRSSQGKSHGGQHRGNSKSDRGNREH